MAKNDRDWIPDATDLDWIESLAAPLPSALAAIEAAAGAARHPDRRPRRGPGAVGAGRRPAADRRGRDGLRLLDAVAGARPAGRRHDRDDRPGPRADRPRPRLVAPGRHRRRADHGRQRARARGVRRRPTRRWPGRSTWSSSTRSSPSTRRISRRSSAGSRRGALVVADNVLWSGRVSGSRPVAADDANTAALRAFDAAVLADPRFTATILPLGDGLLIASWRG